MVGYDEEDKYSVGIFSIKCLIQELESPGAPPDTPPPKSAIGSKYVIDAFIGKKQDEGDECENKNHITLEMEIISRTTGKLTLTGPGMEKQERNLIFSSAIWADMTLCVGKSLVNGWATGGSPIIWDCHNELKGVYFAIGSNYGLPIYIKSIFYQDHYEHNEKCPNCSDPCCCSCIDTDVITLRIFSSSTTEDCAGTMQGAKIVLYPFAGPPVGCTIWSTITPLEFTCLDGTAIHYLNFTMRCATTGETDCEGYVLEMYDAGGNAQCLDGDNNGVIPGVPQRGYVVGTCSCDPFDINFCPFVLKQNPSMLGDKLCECCTEFCVGPMCICEFCKEVDGVDSTPEQIVVTIPDDWKDYNGECSTKDYLFIGEYILECIDDCVWQYTQECPTSNYEDEFGGYDEDGECGCCTDIMTFRLMENPQQGGRYCPDFFEPFLGGIECLEATEGTILAILEIDFHHCTDDYCADKLIFGATINADENGQIDCINDLLNLELLFLGHFKRTADCEWEIPVRWDEDPVIITPFISED